MKKHQTTPDEPEEIPLRPDGPEIQRPHDPAEPELPEKEIPETPQEVPPGQEPAERPAANNPF